MKKLIYFLIVFFPIVVLSQQNGLDKNTIYLLIKLDDVGMCHGANTGAEKIFKTGLPVNASLQVPCSWFPEAAEMVKKYPNVAVGLHMAINSEWKNYKWRPVAGFQNVPSLVDKQGYFHCENLWWWKDSIKAEDLDKELNAQAKAVILANVQFSYVEGHMGSSGTNELTKNAYKKIANQYHACNTGSFGEKRVGFKDSTMETALIYLDEQIKKMQPGLYLLTIHPGINDDEMSAFIHDGKDARQENTGEKREIAVNVIISEEFRKMLEKKNVKVINYRQLMELTGFK